MEAEISEFKGHPMIKLPMGEDMSGKPRYFSFGVKKAQTIMQYLEAIQKFVDENSSTG